MLKRVMLLLQILTLLLVAGAEPALAVPPRQTTAGTALHLATAAQGDGSSLVIKTSERKLYYYDSRNNVRVFNIAVGRQGRKWSGVTSISRKVRNPAWAPPPAIRKDNPKLPAVIGPGPNNPLGVAVLVLGDGTYGIHGTNRDETIGTDASYGCFRMHNKDILALFDKVEIGTTVTVVP